MAHLDHLDRSAARNGRARVRFARLARLAMAALLALAFAPAAQAQFGKNKIQYRDFDWKLYSSPHFTFFYYETEANQLEKVASLAESAYDRLTREFDHQIQDPIPMIFYATHSAFEQNNIILNFIPEGVGAFASPVRNRMVLPIDLPDGELFALILHELTHIFQYDILYHGKVGRGVGGAPQWFMEGMASYMAKDESTSDKMYLRDAVVNDSIPSILQRGSSGFLAYRFGHAAFDFIEERWGKEGFRDFLFEFRNTFGGRADRAVERSFRIDPEDFDLDFRRWLRKKYLPQLVETGEPSDFGRPFRDEKGEIQQVLSPAASPSGDLVAALAVTRGDLDIVLYDTRTRRPIANLTKGYTGSYEYLAAQYLTIGARMGRDLAFSADGNYVAAFAKRERGRSLMIFDVLERKLVKTIEMEVEQQMNPAFSPDGRSVAFAANRAGRFDIYMVDLETEQVTNVTDDETYDGAPVFSPDGASIVFSSVIGENDAHLFRVDLDEPQPALSADRGRLERQGRDLQLERHLAGLHLRPHRHRQHLRHGARDRPDAAAHQRGDRLPDADRAQAPGRDRPGGLRRLLARRLRPLSRGHRQAGGRGDGRGAACRADGRPAARAVRARHPGDASTTPTSRSTGASSSSSRTPAPRSASPTTRPCSATPTCRSATTSATAGW